MEERKAAGRPHIHLREKSQCGHLHGAGRHLVFSFTLWWTPWLPASQLGDSHDEGSVAVKPSAGKRTIWKDLALCGGKAQVGHEVRAEEASLGDLEQN